jgi:hypothetical protein
MTGAGVRIAVLDAGDFFIDGSGRSAIDVYKVTRKARPCIAGPRVLTQTRHASHAPAGHDRGQTLAVSERGG